MLDGFCKCAMCQRSVAGSASYYAYNSRLCFKCFCKVAGMDEQVEEPGDAIRGIANAVLLTICILAGLLFAGWLL